MFQAGKNDRRREKTYDKRKKEKGDRRKMDGKETAKRKQVLEGNAFYEIDLECIKEKQKKTTAGQKTGRKIKNRS